MTNNGGILSCDTPGCEETTPLDDDTSLSGIWYFEPKNGSFVDYCSKHHKPSTLNMDPE